MGEKTRWVATMAIVGGLLASACSPEATRTRGGGPGADAGNRFLGPSLQLHGPVDPDFETPIVGKAAGAGR